MLLALPPFHVLLVIFAITELCIGWIPWLISAHRRARRTFWIALSGVLTAPLPLLFLAVLFWSLLSPTTVADGPGFLIAKRPARFTGRD
jgi:hypothetical protein